MELAGFLLMAGVVGAAHIGKHKKKHLHRFLQEEITDGEQGEKSHSVLVGEKEQAEPVLPMNSGRIV